MQRREITCLLAAGSRLHAVRHRPVRGLLLIDHSTRDNRNDRQRSSGVLAGRISLNEDVRNVTRGARERGARVRAAA